MIGTVIEAGLCTVQDGGRRGYEAVGVPTSGAWHRCRYYALAQLLAGGIDATYPALELVAGTLVLTIHATVDCAVSGPATVGVDGVPAPVGTVIRVSPGQRLRVHAGGDGPVYVGISGWNPPRVLGSCATDTFSRLGGALVRVGDRLEGAPALSGRDGWFLRPESRPGGPLSIIAMDGVLMDDLCGTSWEVVTTSRSGTRLRSDAGIHASGLVDSFPVLPGAVQVTPQGEAIILGPDGGLTGGYPVAGVLAEVARDRVSTLAPGHAVRFDEIGVHVAIAQFEADRTALRRRLVDLSMLA